MRKKYTESEDTKELIQNIIDNYKLTKKEIREIIDKESPINDNFIDLINRSIENNKNDSEATLARKLGKHCNRNSTENKSKMKEIQESHIPNLINENKLNELLKNERRVVVILDGASSHRSEHTKEIAELLNMYLLYLPRRSPELNPAEPGWKYQKYYLRGEFIEEREILVETGEKLFREAYENSDICEKHYIKYIANNY